MRWDEFRTSENVEDRRGDGGGGGIGIPIGGGGLGIGTILVLGVIGWALGIDPRLLIGGAEMVQQHRGSSYQQQAPSGRVGAPSDETGRFAAAVLGNTEDVWSNVLPAQANRQYTPTRLVLYTRGTRSGCGTAQSAMGPFYCPVDKKVYLDTAFFQEMQSRFHAGGDFADAYVIAHEVGHHVQDELGILGKVQARQREVDKEQANQLSVRIELMADCLAGVWAKNSNDKYNAIDQNDIRQAIQAATAIGDDTLQKQSQGYVVPDSFTHGSSEQRVRWLTTGFRSGQIQSCNTFRAAQL